MRQDEQSETFDQNQLFSSPYPFHCFDMAWCLTWPSFQVFWCRQGWQHRGGERRRQRWCSWRSRRQGQSVLWSQMGLRRGPSWTCLPRPKKGKVNGRKLCFYSSRTFTSNVVRRSPQRAGWAEGGIRKLTEETTTNVPYTVLNQILRHVSDYTVTGRFHWTLGFMVLPAGRK